MHYTCGVENTTLVSFIKFLESEHLLNFYIVGDSDECFDNRVKLQKYVYIAQRCGLELPYKHSMYLYGPYSKTLTSHYYKIEENLDLHAVASADLPPEFDRERFLKSIKNDPEWLEIATTLIERNKEIRMCGELVENVVNIKCWATQQQVARVLDHLERCGLTKCVADE